VNGNLLQNNPLVQVHANANWLAGLLRESTGKVFPIKTIITLPAWFIKPELSKQVQKSGVLLLNPKAIASFVNNSRDTMIDEDVHLVAYHLSRYIKGENKITT
jgi:hypothetical protein